MKKPVIFILVILFNVFTTNAQIPIVSGSGSEILHDSTYIFQWNYNTQFWDTMIREVLDYDFRGNITRQLIQRRDTIKDVWNNEEKTVWNYDMTGILTEILTPYWDSNSGAWLNSYRQQYKLLNDGLVKEEVGQTWNSDENAWDNDYKFTRTYDFQGNLIELLSQYGSSGNDGWLNNCRATLYYSEHPVAVETFDNTSDRKMMVFPNPLKETGTFMYPSGQTIRIDIYNESGMLIETLQDMDKDGTSQMRFTEYPPGFYFYHLVNSEGICYSGKLVRE